MSMPTAAAVTRIIASEMVNRRIGTGRMETLLVPVGLAGVRVIILSGMAAALNRANDQGPIGVASIAGFGRKRSPEAPDGNGMPASRMHKLRSWRSPCLMLRARGFRFLRVGRPIDDAGSGPK